MNSILMICPTRNRPDRCSAMWASFTINKRENTVLMLYIADDDPQIEEYKKFFTGKCAIIIGPRKEWAQLQNELVAVHPGFDFYGHTADDYIYRTEGWDSKLIETIKLRGKGWGCACGLDLIHDNWYVTEHPGAAIVSANVINALGYYYYNEFWFMGIDEWQRDFFKELNALFLDYRVIIEHVSPVCGKAEKDEPHAHIYEDPAQEFISLNAKFEWKLIADEEIAKVRKARGY